MDPLPPEFGIESAKVHNVLVELSKITDGDKIVEEIVNQIAPELNHYTEVLVGDDPAVLIARDKRRGDYIVDGVLYRGRISTGVKAPDPEEPDPGPEKPPVVDPPRWPPTRRSRTTALRRAQLGDQDLYQLPCGRPVHTHPFALYRFRAAWYCSTSSD